MQEITGMCFCSADEALPLLDEAFEGRPSKSPLLGLPGTYFLAAFVEEASGQMRVLAASFVWIDHFAVDRLHPEVTTLGVGEGEAYQSFIAVEAEGRGRGLGGRLLGFLEMYARSSGLKVLRAHVRPENASSRRMFAKAGWSEGGLNDRGDRICLVKSLE